MHSNSYAIYHLPFIFTYFTQPITYVLKLICCVLYTVHMCALYSVIWSIVHAQPRYHIFNLYTQVLQPRPKYFYPHMHARCYFFKNKNKTKFLYILTNMNVATTQRFYPQCSTCSSRQGGALASTKPLIVPHFALRSYHFGLPLGVLVSIACGFE